MWYDARTSQQHAVNEQLVQRHAASAAMMMQTPGATIQRPMHCQAPSSQQTPHFSLLSKLNKIQNVYRQYSMYVAVINSA